MVTLCPSDSINLGLECLLTEHRDQEEYSAHGGEV